MVAVAADRSALINNTGAAPARRHRPGIGIRQRCLLIWSGEHLHPENLETLHASRSSLSGGSS